MLDKNVYIIILYYISDDKRLVVNFKYKQRG